MHKIKLGVSTFICNNDQELTDKHLTIIKESGINFIEIGHLDEKYIQRIAEYLHEKRFFVNSLHSAFINKNRRKSVLKVTTEIDALAKLDGNILVLHHPIGERDTIWNKEWIKSIEEILCYAQQKRVKIALARVYQLLGKKERFYRPKITNFWCSI